MNIALALFRSASMDDLANLDVETAWEFAKIIAATKQFTERPGE